MKRLNRPAEGVGRTRLAPDAGFMQNQPIAALDLGE
jgi:hypothetical protein